MTDRLSVGATAAGPEGWAAASRARGTVDAVLLAGAFFGANLGKAAYFGAIIAGMSAPMMAYKLIFGAGVLFPLFFLLLRLRRWWPLYLFYTLQLAFMTANLISFVNLDIHIKPVQYVVLFHEGLALIRYSAVPWSLELLVLLIDLPVLLWMVGKRRQIRTALAESRVLRPLAIGTAVVMAATLIALQFGGHSIAFLLSNPWSGESRLIKRYGVAASNVVDIARLARDRDIESQFAYGPWIESEGRDPRHGNILLVQVEGLGANAIAHEFEGLPIAPYLTELAHGSVYYPYTLTYHAAGGTSDCEFSLINSVEALTSFPSMKLRNYRYPNSVARALADGGYGAFAFHGNYGSFFNRDVAFRQMGYSRFFDRLDMGLPEANWGAKDEEVFEFVLQTMQKQPSPFFFHVITMSSHEPFHYVRDYYSDPRFDAVENSLVRDYFNSISYVDQAIGSFVNSALEIDPLLRVVIVGDHTPFVIDEGYDIATCKIDGRRMEFVPLIIRVPGGRIARETERVATMLDVGPTLLALSGLPFRIRSEGVDLLAGELPEGLVPFKGGRFSRGRLFAAVDGN